MFSFTFVQTLMINIKYSETGKKKMKWTNGECLIELTIAGNWRIEFLYLPRDQKKEKKR